MSRALSADRRRRPVPLSPAWPAPAQLAALGTVLCLYREPGSELAGWQQAVTAHACQRVDSDGVHESLCFLDARGRCVWRLYLLPESDFLAWDQLLAQLPPHAPAAEPGPVGERLWRRLARHVGGQGRRVIALRLHAVAQGQGLAASLAPLSPLGLATARRIARSEGAQIDPALGQGTPGPVLPGTAAAHRALFSLSTTASRML